MSNYMITTINISTEMTSSLHLTIKRDIIFLSVTRF